MLKFLAISETLAKKLYRLLFWLALYTVKYRCNILSDSIAD